MKLSPNEILEYIQVYYPIEYDLVGKTTTLNIINTKLNSQEIKIISSDKGSNFDIVEIIELIAIVVEVIKTIIEIVNSMHRKDEPTYIEEVKKAVLDELSDLEKRTVQEDTFEKLVDKIIQKRNRDK